MASSGAAGGPAAVALKGRIFLPNSAIFSFRRRRHVPGGAQKEKSSSKSCNFLFPAPTSHPGRRSEGEIFFKILQSSLSGADATFRAALKRRNLLQNPAIFSFLRRRHVPGGAQKEKSSSKSCNLLLPTAALSIQSRREREILRRNLEIPPFELAFPASESRPPPAKGCKISCVARPAGYYYHEGFRYRI